MLKLARGTSASIRREEGLELVARGSHALLERVARDEQRHAGRARHPHPRSMSARNSGWRKRARTGRSRRGAPAHRGAPRTRRRRPGGSAPPVVAVGVHHRRRQPERTSVQRLVEDAAELVTLGFGGRPVPRVGAHHPRAQQLVAQEPDRVHRGRVAAAPSGTRRTSPTSTAPRGGTPRPGCPR